jgi:hypothetical protein
MNPISKSNESLVWSLLDYLRDELPGYCFEDNVDTPFIRELLADFPETDILEEIKLFRWCRNNEPFSETTNQRVTLRRWISRAAARRRFRPHTPPW